MLPDFPRLTRHVPACCQISPYSQTLTRMLLSPCQIHLTLSCMLPDSHRITDTLLLVSKLYRLNCASRSMLLQVFRFWCTPRLKCSVLLAKLVPNWPQALAQLLPSSPPALSQLFPSSCPRCCARVARVVRTLSQTLPDSPSFSQTLPDSRVLPDAPRLSQILPDSATFSYALPDSLDAP